MKYVLLVVVVSVMICSTVVFLNYRNFSTETVGARIAPYAEQRKALLVIDVQNDLTDKSRGSAINQPQAVRLIENVNRITGMADKTDLTVIYIRQAFKQGTIMHYLAGELLSDGSTGVEIDSRLKVINDLVFNKELMDAFSNSDFETFLKKEKINHLILTGMDAEACVDRTLKGASNRGYKTTVISDAIATKDDARLQKKIADFKKAATSVITTDELLKLKI